MPMLEHPRAENKVGDPEALLTSIIRDMVVELWPNKGHRPVTLDSSLDSDLGLDSLARMELL